MKTITIATIFIISSSLFANSYTAGLQEYRQKHYKKAIELYTQAMYAKNYKAELNLAYMYNQGIGITVNYTKAFNLYKKAYQDGSKLASYDIAAMYYLGQGVSKNYQKAIKWWDISALQGNQRAAYVLSIMCAKHPLMCHFKRNTNEQ